MKSKILAIDFDGTIVANAFPDIGKPMDGAFEVMLALQAAGHKLVLNTCRENEGRPYLDEAVRLCEENGIVFRSINENHPDDDFRPTGGRKVFAHHYLDDRSFPPFPGWAAVRAYFLD